MGLRADAVGLQGKNAVAGVDGAAHDEVGGHGLGAVGSDPQDDAPAGISVGCQLFGQIADLVDVHMCILLVVGATVGRPKVQNFSAVADERCSPLRS